MKSPLNANTFNEFFAKDVAAADEEEDGDDHEEDEEDAEDAEEETGTMCGKHAVQSRVCPQSNRHMKL